MDIPEHESINGQSFKVTKVVDSNSFIIDCNYADYSPYERNGVAKHVKVKQQLSFSPYKAVLESDDSTYHDENLAMLDFCKLENSAWTAKLYKSYGSSDLDEFTQAIEDYEEKERFKKLAEAFNFGFDTSVGPLCAFLGGLVAQEIVKAITGKFTPIRQEMYIDVMELYNKDKSDEQDGEVDRYSSLTKVFGRAFVEKI
mmetsp:Transcript_10619/g.14313  ORF Transcript_10619/g.14313 Transcript_10619/m.14313 type:complete len:199 (+) Transcript_10619:1081-1677(+)